MAHPDSPPSAEEELIVDFEEDEGGDEPTTDEPKTLSEKRRAQNASFDRWLRSDAAEEVLKPTSESTSDDTRSDELLSLTALMARQSGEIVKNPREYQIELFERAKRENTIAVLDTGSGKTLIAVLLLRWIIDQELEHRDCGHVPRVAFFLVPSVTLAHQQSAVLRSNLDHKVACITGSTNCETWSRSTWNEHFTKDRVIVCTADILQQCLKHGFISMKQINLLIFDEAHHAKKNHAYARIIKDYYLLEPERLHRPRVFGMTASPVDSKSDVAQAARELEAILHCRIATTANMSILHQSVQKPDEKIIVYRPLHQPTETELLQRMQATFGHIPILQGRFERAKGIALELGAWCADHYLYEALSEQRLAKYEEDVKRKFYARNTHHIITDLDEKIRELREASRLASRLRLKASTCARDEEISSKVFELKRWLRLEFESPSDHRCIIFVERRHTARLLHALLKSMGTQHLRCSFLIGAGSPEVDEENFSNRQQVLTLAKFRKGEINCIVATSVAEEGLDVSDCNLIVRFDMYRTMIQYVQSRGRARHRNSKFIHMLEKGNSVHKQLLVDVQYQERAMRVFCEALPEDRILMGNEDLMDSLMAKEKNLRVYLEPSTGAKMTYGNSLGILANFVSAVPNDNPEPLHPTYVVTSQGQKFIAEVILPSNAPIQSAIGKVCSKKTLAKRSAAFEACLGLRKKQCLDAHLMPTYQKKLPAMRNALLAKNLDKKNAYVMRTKPSIWAEGRGSLPKSLFVTVIDFKPGLDRKHQPLALLTRTRMPRFPDFPVYLNSGSESTVHPVSLVHSVNVSAETLHALTKFTFCVFDHVFSKNYEEQPGQLSYWLAPAFPVTADSTSESVIDWEAVWFTAQNLEIGWTPSTPSSTLLNRFLTDPWDGSRKFYSISVNTELKPSDRVPEDCAKHKWGANILDYSVSMFKNTRGRAKWNQDQPVIEAEKVILRRNMLAVPNAKETGVRRRATLCPEPLKISSLTPDVVASCFAFPAVIHRFESCLIALEACELVGVDCETEGALAAVTKDSDNSGEHDSQERINFQHGMGNNYERLEFMGDCFLKTATTVSTFIQNPNDNEFEFHVKRMLLLCNKNLFEVASELKLYEYIRSMAFTRRVWYPQGLKLLTGKGVKDVEETPVTTHSLGQKTIADVCEAMIGAAFLSHNKPGRWHEDQWENAVRAVTKLVGSDEHKMLKWADYRAAYQKPAYQTGEAAARQRDLAGKVELEDEYHFKYPRLLQSAFIHPSQPFSYDKIPNYQRLEFLGDALLDMASITYLFYKFPNKDPQWLTEHKMAMVSNKFLGACCVDIGFHKHLRFTSAMLPAQIQAYETELLEAKRTAGDSKDYWTTVSDPPKCLPDIVESYVGALFIDSDFDYSQVQRFFDTHIEHYFRDMSIYDGFANNHPCTRLHDLLQTTYACQNYSLMARELPGVDALAKKEVVAAFVVHEEVVAHSKGSSGRYARLRAANNAIEVIQGLAPYEFRARFRCDCKAEEGVSEPGAAPFLADCAV